MASVKVRPRPAKTGVYEREVEVQGNKIYLIYKSPEVPTRIKDFLEENIPYVPPMKVIGNTVEMEIVPGKPIHKLSLSAKENQKIKEQIIEFVVAMNDAGWAHRDIHQGNVLWDGEKITVIDWEYVCREPQPLRSCYDLTGTGLESPLNSCNMYIFNQNFRESFIYRFPNLKKTDFLASKKMKLSVAIMSHPSREKWFPYLREKLGPDAKFCIDHDSEGVWPNARKAWAMYDPSADYHLVIQDDAIVCENFYERVQEILQKGYPAYCLYWGNRPKSQKKRAAENLKKGYVLGNTPLWGVAVILSTSIIDDMLKWTAKYPWPSSWGTLADDTRICKYIKRKGHKIYYPLPSLVNHRVEENPTLTDRKKPDRYAAYFVDTYEKDKPKGNYIHKIKDAYKGNTASSYEAKRKSKDRIWEHEDTLLAELLGDNTPTSVLDIPVGTGRFLPLYDSLGIEAIGMDISPDMLEEAKKKECPAQLIHADAMNIPLEDNSIDTTVCFRFFTWAGRADLDKLASEVLRVTKNRVIVSAWTMGISTRRGNTGPIVHSYTDWNRAWRELLMSCYPIKKSRKGNYCVYDIDLNP